MNINLRCGGRELDKTGYGEFNRAAMITLRELGHRVGLDDALIKSEVDLFITPPHSFHALQLNTFNVGWTMTEREDVSPYTNKETGLSWADRCNAMDLILTPSEWNKKVWIKNGVTTPIIVLPMGTRTNLFKPEPYRFLSFVEGIGKETSRWNWEQLTEAYKSAFTQGEDVEWIILGRGNTRDEHEQKEFPKIILNRELLSQEEIIAWYHQCDCYLSYSREGWGCPQWEALACGLDVIIPNYGVLREALGPSPKVFTFPVNGLTQDNLRYVNGDLEPLIELMKYLYFKSREGISFAQSYDWRIICERLITILKDHL